MSILNFVRIGSTGIGCCTAATDLDVEAYFTAKPCAAACWPRACHCFVTGCSTSVAAGRSSGSAPPNRVAKHGSGKNGTDGFGNVGTDVTGELKFNAWARLLMSLLASRSVSGANPQRHSISFRIEV